jgi:hypothetical protein
MIHSQNINVRNIEIECIVYSILLYLFRSTLPILKFPFLISFICLVIYSLINYRSKIWPATLDFFRNFYLPIILFIVLLLSFSLSKKLYLVVFKDSFNAFLLIALFFLMTIYIRTKSDFQILIKKLLRILIFFALIISVAVLFNILNPIPGQSSDKSSWIISITSLSTDYNFAVIPVFYGIISLLYSFTRPVSRIKKGVFTLILIIFATAVLLSGSRRGMICLSSIVTFLIIIQIFKKIKWKEAIGALRKNSDWFVKSVVISVLVLMVFVFVVPVKVKRNTLNFLGISIISYRNLSSGLLTRYSAIFSKADYNHYLKTVWDEKLDYLRLENYWGAQTTKFIHSFPGKNADILPENSVGCMMDKTSEVSTWGNNAYSFTNISNLIKVDSLTARDEYYHASVYCYVSPDFNGDWASISAGISGNTISGMIYKEYDLRKKGEWQKLKISFRNNGQILPVFLAWAKNMSTDFFHLKGYVAFANPEIDVIKAHSGDPDSGWGTEIHTSVWPLQGKNVEIVPSNSIGYKLDSTCIGHTWDNNAYSYTEISSLFKGDLSATQDNKFSASVYCYVSDDFNGTWANISTEGEVFGHTLMQCDLNKKGIWQKITIDFSAKSVVPPVYLYLAKYGVTNFESLKGYIILAYPEYKSITNKNSNSSFFISPLQSGTRQQASSDNRIYYYNAGMMTSLTSFFVNTDNDPVRRWAANLISEDTTYYGYKSELFTDSVENKFLGDRIARWQFAGQIFIKEYGLKEKFVGGGFLFLNWFGYHFQNDKSVSDYPHNPFLSILLYSGIAGLVIYLFFLYRVIVLYLRHIKGYAVFIFLFSITFFFSFFSAGSPFDPPVMGFFMLLPFFINYIGNLTPEEPQAHSQY